MANEVADSMFFLNMGVALTCWLFAWIVGVYAIKAWATARMHRAALALTASA